MKKTLTFIFLFVFGASVYSQNKSTDKPTYKSINSEYLFTLLQRLDELKKIKLDTPLSKNEYLKITHKKQGINNLFLTDINEDLKIVGLIPVDTGNIYIIKKNAIRICEPKFEKIYYFYYVYFDCHYGFVENIYLEDI